jgi:signal transduction histidine kinase
VAIYSIIIYGLVLPIISPETGFEIETLLMITVGTAATIFFFDKVKLIFDVITDRLFFKNNYSLPKFLDEFNQSIINSSDIGDLANSIFKVMENSLKTEFFILIVKDGNFEITIDSRKNESLREADAEVPLSLINYHFKSGARVVLSDFLDKQKFEGLAENLNSNDISAAIDLSEASKTTSSLKKALESGNFKTLLLGPKRSGESYTSQDLDALKIIAKELVIALQNAMRFEEIKLFNLELQHKVDLATGKLRQQNRKLIVADELKDDFLSIASHQMRTPISAINGYASILNSGDAGKLNKDQQKFAKIIQESTKRLSYLINDFLTISRLKSGKFSIEKSLTNLKEMLKGEADNLEGQFEAKEIELKLHIDSGIEPIQADESKLRQVMMNLIDNAMHYTPAGGKVDVTLKKVGNLIVFEVKDSGIGVPKEDQSDLFSKMFRASNAKKMRPDGTGLGLYLAKKVIIGHNGHIIFKSAEGEGSTFGFKIPIK